MIMEVKMKKLIYLLGILIVITGFSFSQTLTITNPSGAVTWSLNTTHLIQWTYGGNGDIMIQLFQSGSPTGTVYNGENTGNLNWTIDKYLNGNPIATGSYKLRVRSKNNSSIYAEVDLTITNSGSSNEEIHLEIINPNVSVSWAKYTTHTISWSYNGEGDIMIQLFQSGSPAGTIYNGANSGSFSWTIDKYLNGNPIATGSYKLRVRSKLDSSKYDEISIQIKDTLIYNPKIIPDNNINKQQFTIMKLPDFYPYGEQLGYISWKHKIVKYHVAVKNKGQKDANNVPVKLEIYLRGTPGHIVKTINHTYPSIPKGMTVVFDRTYQLNNIGTYDFIFKVNPDATVNESVYSNNSAKRMTISREKLPDLIVWLMTPKVDIISRSRIWIGVKNIGTKTSSPTKLKVYIQTKGTKYLDIPAIAPGNFYTAERKEWFHSLKDVWVEMWIDPYNTLREDREDNNHAKTKLKVWSHTIFDK